MFHNYSLKHYFLIFSYDNPVDFLQGDEVKVTCGFKTKDRPKTTFQGEGTSDEMCYGFLTFYPAENIQNPYCVSWKSVDVSRMWGEEVNGCNVREFLDPTNPNTIRLHQKILSHCAHLGLCLKECMNVVKEVKRSEPCLQGDIHDWLRNLARNDDTLTYLPLALLFSALDSCNTELALESCPMPTAAPGPVGGAAMAVPSYLLMALMIVFLMLKY